MSYRENYHSMPRGSQKQGVTSQNLQSQDTMFPQISPQLSKNFDRVYKFKGTLTKTHRNSRVEEQLHQQFPNNDLVQRELLSNYNALDHAMDVINRYSQDRHKSYRVVKPKGSERFRKQQEHLENLEKTKKMYQLLNRTRKRSDSEQEVKDWTYDPPHLNMLTQKISSLESKIRSSKPSSERNQTESQIVEEDQQKQAGMSEEEKTQLITSARMHFQEELREKERQSKLSSRERYLFSTSSMRSEENFAEGLVGQEAVLQYQNMYKRVRREQEIQDMAGTQFQNPLLKYLNQVDQKKISPKGFGFIHRKKADEMNLSSFYLPESHVDAFSDGIKLAKDLQKLNLARNQLSTNRAIRIINKIPTGLIELDLSNNQSLTIEAYKVIAEQVLENKRYQLERLILEGCKITDDSTDVLCKALEYNTRLRFLNLSRNDITCQGAKSLAEMVTHNGSIRVLFLHWNQLGPKGGQSLARGLRGNRSVQILDVSFCALGQGLQVARSFDQNAACKHAEEWAACFQENESLLHVDISNNDFVTREVQAIAEGLKENHSVLGIHINGNEASVDAMGFLHPLQQNQKKDAAHTHIFTRIQPTLQCGTLKNSNLLKLKVASNCWICEGWAEFKFDFKLPEKVRKEGQEVDHQDYRVNLHMSCDMFTGELLLPEDEEKDQSYYSTIRMVPPGEASFYFTVNGQDFITERGEAGVKVKESMSTSSRKRLSKIQVPKTNVIENVIQSNALLTHTYLSSMKCLPRPLLKEHANREKLRTPWDFFKSVFRDYKPDTEAVLDDCFEFDWSSSKIPKILKGGDEEVDKVKKFLRDHYKAIRETYKFYSAVGPVGFVCSIGSNVLSDIVSNCDGFVDHATFKLSDLDLEFVATNAGLKKNNPRNPERQLVRHQLMEILVRLAQDKYVKSGATKLHSEAVRLAWEQHFGRFFDQFDCHRWRKDRLWNEPCDITFKRLMRVVQALYQRYSGKYAMPGQTKYMSMDEFVEMVTLSGVVDDSFGSREIQPLFNLSMMTQKNELDFDRHFNMIQVEFIEAIARVADKLVNLPNFFPEVLPEAPNKLDKKIESFLMVLMKNCLPVGTGEQLEKAIRKDLEVEMAKPKRTKFGIEGKKY